MPVGIYSHKVFNQNYSMSDEYNYALNLYWQGSSSELIDFVSEKIMSDPPGFLIIGFPTKKPKEAL